MRNRDVHVGMRVELKTLPWTGRVGTVRGQGKLMFTKVWEVWCDHPDALGRQLLKVSAMDIKPYEGAPAPAPAVDAPEAEGQASD